MKICVIGKYPPIQGGVSRETYWLARGLAERGHWVTVITNSQDVEPDYRMFLDHEDNRWLESSFAESGGAVRVLQTEPFSHRRMDHIPLSSPFVSQLAGLAAAEITKHGIDLIIGYYLEPYGVAAHLASVWTGRPYFIKHAGSDIDRLMLVPGLGETYRRIFQGARYVLTQPGLIDRFLRMGLPKSRLATGINVELPDIFSPASSPMDVGKEIQRTATAMCRLPDELAKLDRQYDPALPAIGIYGKVGEFKGSYDLIAALTVLKREGLKFNFLTMVSGQDSSRFNASIVTAGLARDSWILPFLPHWRVPGFIRSCTAVCFLERDFPIAIHGPSVPREIMSCGTCLVVSGEIAKKQRKWFDFEHRVNCYIAEDPKNHRGLAEILREVVLDPLTARRIGDTSIELVRKSLGDKRWSDSYEELFEKLSRSAEITVVGSGSGSPSNQSPTQDRLAEIEQLLPFTTRLLKKDARYTEPEVSFSSAIPIDAAIQYCDKLLEYNAQTGKESGLLRHVILFERFILSTAQRATIVSDDLSDQVPLGDRYPAEAIADNYFPMKSPNVAIYQLEYDLHELDLAIKSAGDTVIAPKRDDASILIQPLPNSAIRLIRITAETNLLLSLCDGTKRRIDVVDSLLGRLDQQVEPDGPRKQVISALNQFWSEGFIVLRKSRATADPDCRSHAARISVDLQPSAVSG